MTKVVSLAVFLRGWWYKSFLFHMEVGEIEIILVWLVIPNCTITSRSSGNTGQFVSQLGIGTEGTTPCLVSPMLQMPLFFFHGDSSKPTTIKQWPYYRDSAQA